MLAALLAGISFAASLGCWKIDAPRRRRVGAAIRTAADRFALRDLLRFGPAYWYLVVLCVLWYAVIFAFRSTFAIEYFQHTRDLDLASAGSMNSYVFFAAIFATPFFGWVCDRFARHASLLVFGSLLLPVSIAAMALTHWNLWIATTLIGISFSLVPAVMWPMIRMIVPAARFGTAIGFMWVVQNAGIGGANLLAGWLNDSAGAGAANPGGYQPMMAFFGAASTLGFVFAVLLWMAGKRARSAGTASAAA